MFMLAVEDIPLANLGASYPAGTTFAVGTAIVGRVIVDEQVAVLVETLAAIANAPRGTTTSYALSRVPGDIVIGSVRR